MVDVENEAQAKIVQEKVREWAEVRAPQKWNPKLMLYNIPKNYDKEEVVKDFIEQNLPKAINEEQSSDRVKICFATGPCDKDTYNLVIQLSGPDHKTLVRKGKAFLNWNSVRVADFVPVTRCYRCQKYGHISKVCNAERETCGHCGRVGHERNNCTTPNSEPKCSNCRPGLNNHSVHAKECPS